MSKVYHTDGCKVLLGSTLVAVQLTRAHLADLISLDLRNLLFDLMLRCNSLGRLSFSLFGNGNGVGEPGADRRSSSALVRDLRR